MSPDSALDVSLCIVSWNVADDLRVCLQSLRDQQSPPRFETIVVDNASADETVEMLKRNFPEVRIVANDDNQGFAGGTNQGLRMGAGRYLMLLNPDTILPPDALATVVAVADAHPEAGIVAPKLLNTDGSLQPSCRRFPTITAALYRNTLFGRLLPRARAASRYIMEDFDHNVESEVDWVSGACMMVRREALESVGELDEGFPWGSEDVDFCLRMSQVDWVVLYTPATAIVHAIGRSSSQAVVPTIIRSHRGMYHLYAKHFARNPVSRGLVWLGVWLRAGLLIASWRVWQARVAIQSLFRRPGGGG